MCVHMYKSMTRVCDTYNAHTAVSNPSSKHNIMYTCSPVHLQSSLPLRGGGGGGGQKGFIVVTYACGCALCVGGHGW